MTTDVKEPEATPVATAEDAVLPLNGHASPQHLRAVAQMYGMDAPVLETARVLVLGCDTGANLIPFCAAWPGASAIGIDIDMQAIAQGQGFIERGGIANLQLYCVQLDELLGVSPGKQDYIILQGVFTLLDNATREAVLAWCRQHLSENGVIALQWPCYPGARNEESLRDAMLLHSSLVTSEEEKISSARAAATWLKLGMSENNPLHASLQPLLQGMDKQSDTLVALRYLSGLNEASWLVDFNALAERTGLTYLGDAEPWTEVSSFYGTTVAQLHQVICPHANKVLHQQYLDFAVNRQQRFSLLVGEQHKASVLPLPEKQRLKALSWASNFKRLFDPQQKPLNAVITPGGEVMSTDHPLTLRVLDTLAEAWPLSLSFTQLVFHTALPEEKNDNHADNVLNVLWSLFLKGSKALFYCLGACPYSQSTNKVLLPLPGLAALSEPRQSPRLGFNYWHQAVALTEEEHQLIARGVLHCDVNNLKIMDILHRKGCITGSTHAWRNHLQQVIALQPDADSMHFINSLMFFTYFGMEEAFRIPDAINKGACVHKNYPGTSAYKKPHKRFSKKIYHLVAQGNTAIALELAAKFRNEQPENPHAWYNHALILSQQHRDGEALRDLAKAISLESTQWEFYSEYACRLWKIRHPWFAEKIARYCLRFNSKSAELWSLLCSLNKDRANLDLAEKCARKALAINPMHTTVLSNLGIVLSNRSNPEEAISWLRKACESSPNDFVCFTNYLFELLHSPTVSAEFVFAEHQRYGRMVTRWAEQQGGIFKLANDKDHFRRLRVGFVSGDLGLHAVSNFIQPIWNALDPEQFMLYAYATKISNDPVMHQLREKAAVWCEAESLGSPELAKRIHQDEIDILIDLSGHTAYNRLPAFGLKPAPITMSFIGYLGTTGLTEMDYYLLHDKLAKPGEMDNQFTEALIYLPFNQQFSLFYDVPEVNAAPAISNQIFTFGSFNRPNKINDAVLTCWAEVLRRCENSRMLIGGLNDEVIEKYTARFAELGIADSRLIMRKRSNMLEYMQMHAEVDLLLDTFPYPSGTTANYGLQMGVPTLTLAGETPITCQGAAGMRQFGLDEFVAYSREEYISRAVEIAGDAQALNAIRLTLRDRIARQSSKDDGNPAVYLEAALREAWRRYCRGDAVTSFSAEKYVAGEKKTA